MTDDLTRHRVAVAVFADVLGVDQLDASNRVEAALRGVLRKHGAAYDPQGHPVTVVAIRDVGVAAANGYLWTSPTNRAWRDRGMEAP